MVAIYSVGHSTSDIGGVVSLLCPRIARDAARQTNYKFSVRLKLIKENT